MNALRFSSNLKDQHFTPVLEHFTLQQPAEMNTKMWTVHTQNAAGFFQIRRRFIVD